jgi:hypothetical protein
MSSSSFDAALLKQLNGRSFFRPDLTRATAEAHLRALPVGAFVVRPSSSSVATNAVALSFVQQEGVVGHNTIVCVHDPHRVPSVAFRLDNGSQQFSTLKALLRSLPLRFVRREHRAGVDAVGGSDDDDDDDGDEQPDSAPAAPPRRESNLLRGNLLATRQALVDEQVSRLLRLMPAQQSQQAALQKFDACDFGGSSRAALDELAQQTRGPVNVKLFFDVVAPSSSFLTLGISKTATARQVLQLVANKRLFPFLHRAVQLCVVVDADTVKPMSDLDRPAGFATLWAAKKLPPSARAFVVRLKTSTAPTQVVDEAAAKIYGFVPRARKQAGEAAAPAAAAGDGVELTDVNQAFFFELPPTSGGSEAFGVELDEAESGAEFLSGFEGLLKDFDEL